MYKLKEIADKVYYVGVNDRQKALFENMWPLPYGVSYNSYLIVDEKTVLIFIDQRINLMLKIRKLFLMWLTVMDLTMRELRTKWQL